MNESPSLPRSIPHSVLYAARRHGDKPAIVDGAQEQWERVTHGAGGGLAWPALLRRLDRRNPGYQA